MQNLHEKFTHYGKQARYWIHKCELLLPEIEKRGIWRQKGFSSIYEYAAKLAGMNHEKVNDCLRIMKKIEDKPELIKVVEQKGIGAVRPVATIATKETAQFWAEKAKMMSKHTLETYVKDCKTNEVCPGTAELTDVNLKLNPQLAKRLEQLKKRADFEKLLEQFLNEVEEESKPEPIKSESPYIPAKIKQHVATKTSGLCSHPNCTRPAVNFHHPNRFALNHNHDPNQIRPLCKAHHQIAHYGLIGNEQKEPYEWTTRREPDKQDPNYQVDKLVQEHLRF